MPQRSDQHCVGWAPFERWANRYDQWFDSKEGRRIFRLEAECIRDLLIDAPRPWLEVGVGTGRFAAALRVDDGVDPSPAVLKYAKRHAIRVKTGAAESLPYRSNSFGVALLIVTICFLEVPAKALAECHRVLRPDGYLVIGLVPKDSPWGQTYAREGEQGHPFYSAATFYTCRDILRIARMAGFNLEQSRSCLFKSPGVDVAEYEPSREGIINGAGFVCMQFKTESKRSLKT